MSNLNPPCTGDALSCGKQYNRSTACYQVPPNYVFKANWINDTASGVKQVDSSLCPDSATFPTYDATTGSVVTRDPTTNKVVIQTVCAHCNYAVGVNPWVQNPCPCIKPGGDYCQSSSTTGDGVCHLDNTIPCNTKNCPATPPTLSNRYIGNNMARGMGNGSNYSSYGAALTEKAVINSGSYAGYPVYRSNWY